MGDVDDQLERRNKPRPYRCFLVRCWLETDVGLGGEPAWRFTIRQAGFGGQRRSFTTIKDVEAYLEAELATCMQQLE